MSFTLFLFAFLSSQEQSAEEARVQAALKQIAESGRVLQISADREGVTDPRTQIAPGAPPLLAFRYFAGADRHRFGKLDLVLDDAGH